MFSKFFYCFEKNLANCYNNNMVSNTYNSGSAVNYCNYMPTGQTQYGQPQNNPYQYGQAQKFDAFCITAFVTSICGLIIARIIFGIVAIVFGSLRITKFDEQIKNQNGW